MVLDVVIHVVEDWNKDEVVLLSLLFFFFFRPPMGEEKAKQKAFFLSAVSGCPILAWPESRRPDASLVDPTRASNSCNSGRQ